MQAVPRMAHDRIRPPVPRILCTAPGTVHGRERVRLVYHWQFYRKPAH